MGPHRLTLAGLMGLVVLAAASLASLRYATEAWTAVASTAALAVLLSALLAARLLRGRERAFWGGFALFGWAYLVLVNWSWIGEQFGHDLTAGLGDLAERVHAVDPLALPIDPAARTEAGLQNRIKIGNFLQIGRLILTLLFALLGGFVGHAIAAAADRHALRSPSPNPSNLPAREDA